MYHRFDIAVNKTTGVPIPGTIVRVFDQSGAQVSLFADMNGTPIESLSGIANAAVADDAGNYSYYVGDGIYSERIYSGDALVLTIPNMTLKSGTDVDPNLSSLKSAAIDNISRIYSGYVYYWSAGDYTGQADDDTVIESNVADITTGAWIKRSIAPTDLASSAGAGKVGAADGNTVQANIDARTYQIGSKQAADAAAPTIPAAVTRIVTAEQITGSGKGAAPFIRVGADPGAGYGASEKFQDAAGNWLQMAGDLGMVTSYQFGDRGPGYDNSAAINDWLRHIARMGGNKGGLLAPWESYCATPLDLSAADLDGVSLFGAQGQSFLTSDAAYHVLRLGNTKGVEINGIGFRSDYANAAVDPASAVVYSFQNSHENTIFRRCSFSAPNANTSGLSLYTAINYLDSAASVDGCLIEDCTFENLGCQGSTIMNRSTDPSRMKRVHFIRCVARHLGLNGNYGFAVSFDGTGDQCSYQDGWLEDLFGIGLENVGYHNTHFLRNTGINFSRGWGMLSINGTRADDPDTWGPEAGVAQTMYGCRIEANRQIGDSTGALSSYVSDLERSSTWRDNDLFANSASVILALTVRRCSDLKFTNGSYVNYAGTGGYAVLVDSGTTQPVTRCTFDGCYADNSASGANGQAVIGFSGSVATNNLITNAMLKKASAGFTIAQNSSAVGSVCDPYVDGSGNRIGEYLSLNMGDADVTLSGEQAMLRYKAIRILSGNTLTRNLNFPSRRQIEQAPRVINNGTTAVQLQCAGVNGSALAGGASATLVYDSALGSVRAI